jgi:hypothetical protein
MLQKFFTHKVFSGVFCKYFIRMFRVFQQLRTYVAIVSSWCFKSRYDVAASVLMHVSCVSSTFRHMLQVLHLHVSKVDRVLHLSLRFFATSPSPRCLLLLLSALARHLPPPPSLLDADHVYAREKRRGRERGLPTCRRAYDAGTWGETEYRCVCLDADVRSNVWALALPIIKGYYIYNTVLS